MNIFNRIEEQLETGYPFAVFCKPASNQVTAIFQNNGMVHYLTDPSRSGFVMTPFSNRDTVYIPYEGSDVISETFLGNSEELMSEPQPLVDFSAKDKFVDLVQKSIAAIRGGRFDKIVTSRSENAETRSTPSQLYQKLLTAYPLAYRYCFYTPTTGLWMGATPEQLLKVENNTLHTVALAGTQVYKPGKDAVWEPKERREQEIVTDYIVNELKEFVSQTRLAGPYTFQAGNLVHLKTDISAELKPDALMIDVVQKLHPTPAVCGLPKEAARRFLQTHEGYDREYYSGYLGEWNADLATGQNKTDLFVNLRCMKVEGNSARLFIGCGITAESDPEKEFFETVNKSMTMRRVL